MADPSILLQILREPISGETRARLAETWRSLPAALRSQEGRQFQGRQVVGCGATIGAMPRCDFACRGCYLGPDANRIPPLPLDQVKRQLDRLRDWLGEGGNVQLTDGELTLLPRGELVELVRHARALKLHPMLMSHGEHLRRDPDLLETLMVEGGLREISLHVDTTQRGRRDPRARGARDERDLDPLRDALAERIRRARRTTGRPLEAATTVTVDSRNLSGVAGTVRWLLHNADAFKMASFQPLARVGRTQRHLEGVDVESLWDEIARGLGDGGPSPGRLREHQGWLGHPGCSRFVQGLVLRAAGEPPRYAPLLDVGDPVQRSRVAEGIERLGGLSFRGDTRLEAGVRAAALALRHPAFLAGEVLPELWRRLDRAGPGRPGRLLRDWLVGRTRIHYLNLVSHHFMSAEELATPTGRERLASCAFRVPVDGELVSMCEFNALGHRERFYESLRHRASGARKAVDPEVT